MSKIVIASSAGYCFGVERSIKIAEKELATGICYCLGELIHNRDAVRALEDKGMKLIASTAELPIGEKVVIRSHGERENVYKELKERKAVIIDATCPHVDRIHRIVKSKSNDDSLIIVIGDKNHPEVQGICSWCKNSLVLENAESFIRWYENKTIPDEKFTVVFQTTQLKENYDQILKYQKKQCTNFKLFDTICGATAKRQKEADLLSSNCDRVIVIGAPNSANSRHLAEICRKNCADCQFIENASQLNTAVLKAGHLIGITAGASVPPWIIKEVVKKMSDEIKVEEITAEEVAATAAEEAAPVETVEAETAVEKPDSEKTFEELLEDSIRMISNGDTVSGYVVGITNTDVTVDLGTKHSGYIPTSEFTDDGTKIEDAVHVGDMIEACVVRVNDVEGTVMLSKKRLDSIKSWSDIENAQADGSVVEGKVTEENKGGVVVSVHGIRVFVPASQTGLPRDAAMSELVGQTVRLKVTEVNRGRKRVVGSIRAVASRERKERVEKIWNEIEVGKHYEGTVKSMTSYGAFVDIGGIDGMVHVSEISWKRITKPADALSIGDKIDVYVISFDKENHKISLGHRDPNQNPWTIFTNTYAVGDVAKVTVVKLMDFGAFAEVVPGVDGLIHISQIANRRIAKPSEVLTVGDVVDAKITNIDFDKKKISLSIRALSEPAPAPVEEEPVKEESADDALVYEVSADGVASGNAPETEE